MDRFKHADWRSRSTVDNASSEDTNGNSASIYRVLLTHHQEMLENGEGDEKEWKLDNKESSIDTVSNSGSSRSRSQPSFYPRIVDDSFEADRPDSIDLTSTASGLSRAGSFYQEALKAASQSQNVVLDDGNEAISTSTATVDSDGKMENEETIDDLSASISPFYLEALENAALVEEEELSLLEQHKENYSDRDTVASTGSTADNKTRGTLQKQSSFYRSALEQAISLEQNFGAGDSESKNHSGTMQRQSTICSFSSASSSSCVDTLTSTSVSTSVDSARLLSLGTTGWSEDLFQAHRRFSNISISSFSDRQDEMDMIAPNPCPRSFVDDSSAFSVTRSSAIPHLAGSVLLTTANQGGTCAPRCGDKGKFMEKSDLLDVQNNPNDSEDDEDDEDLQMAIYLSRVESLAASSLNSEGTRSASLSTKGSPSVLEGENKNEGRSNPSQASYSQTNCDEAFLMSQFRAMEECQRNNPRANQSSRDASTSSSSTTTATSMSSSQRRSTQRRRSLLETRGAIETRQAISNGDSHVVKCNGCKRRLQAPLHYSLVFCPKCQTVSPA